MAFDHRVVCALVCSGLALGYQPTWLLKERTNSTGLPSTGNQKVQWHHHRWRIAGRSSGQPRQERNYPLKHTTDLLDDALAGLRAEMDAYATLAKMIVVLAPLAGLLGTVTGMMETFDSLATMALFTQSGGVAGGISQALISTQMGLAVAIPGVIAGRLIDRKQSNLTTELEELKQHALGQLGLLESDAAQKDGSL